MGKISIVTNTKKDILISPVTTQLKFLVKTSLNFKKQFAILLKLILENYMQIKLPLNIALRANISP